MALFGSYLIWHYTSAFADLLFLYRNFLWFIAHFFSFSTLLKTLISPWRRLGERYRGGFHPSAWLETLLVNFFMRVIGLVFRLVLLGVGAVVWLLVLIGSLLFLVIWPFLPLAIFSLIWLGIQLIV